MVGGPDIDTVPGFRRRFFVHPSPARVIAAVEDDYHCMAVALCHDDGIITAVEPVMDRVPWTTCPGALEVIAKTFTGVRLADAAARGEKPANCTHLHDLALLAAAHAHDSVAIQYDIVVSDPVEGRVIAEIRRDGEAIHRLIHQDDRLESPAGLAGLSLFALRDWIRSLPAREQEAARLLQWGAILAHGRTYPMDRQSDASKMPPNCYTFQPPTRDRAVRIGTVFDFSQGRFAPLDHFENGVFTPRAAAAPGAGEPNLM